MEMATNTAIATRKMMSSTVSSPRKWTALARNRFAESSESRPGQNLTSMDRLIRFSIFLRSGVNPGTKAPGDPQIFSTIGAVEQDVGVTPPGPEKYGTFAARWSNSPRKVMYWLGM